MRRPEAIVAAVAFAPLVVGAQTVDVDPTLRLRLSTELRAKTIALPKRAVSAAPFAALPLRRTAELDVTSPDLAPTTSVLSPPTAKPKPAEPERYVDRVMDDSKLDAEAARAEAAAEAELKGRRFLSADYKIHTRDGSGAGRSMEQGLGLRYRRETANYGELYLDAELRNYQPASSDNLQAQALKSRITLSQYRYALTETKQMDNTLGVVRNNANALVSSSFRIQLPSSILQGATSTIYDQNSEWRLMGGQLGKLTGIAAQQFDNTKGSLAGVGYTRAINSNWSASAQLYSLTGHETVADHQTIAWATQYLSDNRSNRLQMHGLTDSKGHSGLWFDADQRLGLLQNRYGLFRMQPHVMWTDALIVSDQQGAYWRSDYRTQRYTVSGGADYTDNNVNNDPARGGTRIGAGFLSGFMRWDRTLALNGNVSASHSEPKFVTPGAAASTTYLSNASLSKTMALGVSRLQVSHNQTDSAVSPSREDVLRWDHDWSISSALQISTTLAHTWASNNGVESTHPTLGLLVRHFIGPAFRWDGNINFNRVRDSAGRADNNTNAALNGNWSIAKNWSAQLQLIWNRVDNTNPVAPVYTNDKTVLFMLRYESASGTPLAQLGRSTGGLGSGRIVGRVFFDDNGDGTRQPTEKPVAGLTVLLDGRYPVVTDNEGRFEFGPVSTGAHMISVTVERVPLPWGLLDETPRRVNVPLRGESVLDIPLNKLNQ